MLHDFEPEILTTGFGSIYWYGSVYSFGFMGVFLWFWSVTLYEAERA